METLIELLEESHTVRVSGEADLAAAAALRDAIERARSTQDGGSVVIDLEAVTFIDSSGLNEVLRPAMAGCSVTLRRPNPQVRTVLELAGVTELFSVAED